MSTLIDNENDLPLPEAVRAEAAVWLSRLHSDGRTEQTEAAFRRWLAESPLHRAAFERMTAIWESTASFQSVSSPRVSQAQEFGHALRRVLLASAATLTICALMTVGVFYLIRLHADSKAEIFVTAFGQRRPITLADGSRLDLNTDSRVKVTYSSRIRRVILEKVRLALKWRVIHPSLSS